MNKLKKNIIPLIIVLLSLIMMATRVSHQNKSKIFAGDVIEYYLYFPAYIIMGDSDFDNDLENVSPLKGWTKTSPEGKTYFKFTMGVTLLNLPFLLVSHVYCLISGTPADGFTDPYAIALLLGSIFYLLVALYFSRKLLLEYFQPLVADIVILLLFLTTNLGYFVFFLPGMSHVYSLAVISAYLYYTQQWYKNKKVKYLVYTGITMGLIFLIRPANMVLFMVFVLWGCTTFTGLWERIRTLATNKYVYLIPLIIIIIAFPQLLYWKVQTGSWFFYSYSNESFFFSDPRIIETLFSFRNGLLIYSPVLILAFTGLFFLKNRLKELHGTVLITSLLFIYILSSWWCWWYIGFGNRAFIDIFGLLAIPFAVTIEKLLKLRNYFRIPMALALLFLAYLSYFQMAQAERNIVHYDGMNRETYFLSFLNNKLDESYFTKLTSPNYSLAKKGFRSNDDYDQAMMDEIIIMNGNEYSTSWSSCAPRYYGFAKHGDYSQKLDAGAEYSSTYADTIKNIFVTPPDSISLSTWFYPIKDSTDLFFVVNILDKDSILLWDARPLRSFQKGKESWQFAKVYYKWDKQINPECIVKLYIWNRSKEDIFIDDFAFSMNY
jgi:hypothetical protein